MRKVFILKTILDLLFILSLFGVLSFISFFMEDTIKVNGYNVTAGTLSAKIVLCFWYIGYLLFVYGIYLFRKTAYLFLRVRIFNEKVIKNLNKIGILLIIITICTDVSLMIYSAIEHKNIGFRLDTNPVLFKIAVGLLFMTLSEVLKISTRMKEENELTI
ncbi:DUF2975 domain-containing protein [Capnocytophaga stomatis]|uniref:DUF2975 domain-containing protein n=1 Tax=Capnocytophaga stomatis TaxID=1848904 RepID=A0A250G0L9_9FLAO|nr:DUF2975 domain-containing protein [Capnocytophaga stomatis]ATA89747.1 hypothetical protein CGC58_08395 [Capnocytophaga stomatis]GIJ94723.1 hypothetical protein CAPN002_19410 [Capnocytophaga stomatis]GIJ97455.1 hypothetical protein CAPN001_20240 [Capnocytophaga stomatis]